MRNIAPLCLLLVGIGPTCAASFKATITNVDRNEITMTRYAPDSVKGEFVKMTAADSCKVFTMGLDVVNEGLRSKFFVQATIKAWITTDGGKVTRIWVHGALSNRQFDGVIKKVEGGRITLMRQVWYATYEPSTWTAAESCRVVHAARSDKGDYVAGEPVEGHFKNKMFADSAVSARIQTDGEKVTDIWVCETKSNLEFAALITGMAGNKITLMRVAWPLSFREGELSTWTAADDCKVLSSDDLEYAGGVKNEHLRQSTLWADIKTDGTRIVEIRVSEAQSRREFEALIHRARADRLTATKSIYHGGTGARADFPVRDNCVVLRGGEVNRATGRYEGGERIQDGLKNDVFADNEIDAHITLDDDGKVSRIGIVSVRVPLVDIQKVDGDQLLCDNAGDYTSSYLPQGGILAVSPRCQVFKGCKLDGQTGRVDGGTIVAAGLSDDMFDDSTVTACLVLESNKVTKVQVLRFHHNKYWETIKKAEGNKITLKSRSKEHGDKTLTATDSCKVLHGASINKESDRLEGGKPFPGGLKNAIFANSEVEVELVKRGDRVVEIHVFGVTLTNEAAVTIKKAAGNQITVVKEDSISAYYDTEDRSGKYAHRSFFGALRVRSINGGPVEQRTWTLTAAESCAVIRGAKLNKETLRYEGGEQVAAAFKSADFAGATVRARIVKEEGKVARLYIISVTPESEFEASIIKVENGKITLARRTYAGSDKETVWTAADACKVLHKVQFNDETQRYEGGAAVAGGLKSDIFAKSVRAWVVTQRGAVQEVWVIGPSPE